jgi:hypothetical protein
MKHKEQLNIDYLRSILAIMANMSMKQYMVRYMELNNALPTWK